MSLRQEREGYDIETMRWCVRLTRSRVVIVSFIFFNVFYVYEFTACMNVIGSVVMDNC